MFIPEFVCGVLATLITEVVALIVYAIIKVKFKDFAQYEIFRIIAVPVGQNL